MTEEEVRLDNFTVRASLQKIGAPSVITCELTYRCHLRCRHCYLVGDDHRGGEIDLADWVRIIDEASEMNVMSIVYTGGEPTLYPGFWELLQETARRNFLIRLFTNGYDYDEEKVERLVKANVCFIELSLHGADAATQDAISGVPGSFDRIVRSIRLMRAAGLYVKIKTSLIQQNVDSYAALEKLAVSLGGQYRASFLLSPDNCGDCYVQRDQLSREQIIEAEKSTHDWSRVQFSFMIRDSFRTAIACSAGVTSLCVCPNGDVLPCLQTRFTLGNAVDTSLKRIWFHSSRRQYWMGIRHLVHPDCRGCKYADYCNHCAGIAFVESGSAWKPSRTICNQARDNAYVHEVLGR